MQWLLVSSIFMSMATIFLYIYVMATSFFYIYIDIYKLTERPVVLLSAIFVFVFEHYLLSHSDYMSQGSQVSYSAGSVFRSVRTSWNAFVS